MSKNKHQVWKTKYGVRRVRHEAPTLEEAIAAAQGLSDELKQQAEIAAALICVYRKPKPAHSGDEARRGSGVNL
jgi:hypothetical protein